MNGASAPKKKRGRRSARAVTRLELIARQPLGKTASVAVVRVADRTLLLGVTDSDVRLLSEFDASLFDEVEETVDDAEHNVVSSSSAPAASAVRADAARALSFLDVLRERTVRRA